MNTITEDIEALSKVKLSSMFEAFSKGLQLLVILTSLLLGAVLGALIFVLFVILYLIALVLWNGIITGNFSYSGEMNGGAIILPITIGCSFFLGYILSVYLRARFDPINIIKSDCLYLYTQSQAIQYTQESIEEILKITTTIQRRFVRISRIISWKFLFSDSGGEVLQKILEMAGKIVYQILDNLRTELERNIQERKEELQKTVSSLSNTSTISGVIHVFELQKIRLNQQIEKFEELQRVLIKV